MIEAFESLLGAKAAEVDPKDARRLKEANSQQGDTASDVRWIQEDLGHYFARTEKDAFKQMFDAMRESKIDMGLDDVRGRLRDNHSYLATEGAKHMVGQTHRVGQKTRRRNEKGPAGRRRRWRRQPNPEDEDFEFMLRVMKMIQQQQDLRARTRALEQFRRSAQPAPAQPSDAPHKSLTEFSNHEPHPAFHRRPGPCPRACRIRPEARPPAAKPGADKPPKPEDAIAKHHEGSTKVADKQDELSADVQQLTIEQTIPKVIELFKEVEDIMDEATDWLAEYDTGGRTIAAQTEVIEKIFEASKERQKQSGSGSKSGGAMMDMMEKMMQEGEGKERGQRKGKSPATTRPGHDRRLGCRQ